MQTLDKFSVGLGIAVDNALVALVCHVLANAVLVVGHEYALAMPTVLGIQLHYSMHCRSATGEEVENGRVFMTTNFADLSNKRYRFGKIKSISSNNRFYIFLCIVV